MGFVHSMYPVFDYSILFSITPVSIGEEIHNEVLWDDSQYSDSIICVNFSMNR